MGCFGGKAKGRLTRAKTVPLVDVAASTQAPDREDPTQLEAPPEESTAARMSNSNFLTPDGKELTASAKGGLAKSKGGKSKQGKSKGNRSGAKRKSKGKGRASRASLMLKQPPPAEA